MIKGLPKCIDCKYDCFGAMVSYSAISCDTEVRCKILDSENPNCHFYKTIDEYMKGKPHDKRSEDANN